MSIRIVDNKKLEMTDSEYGLYQNIIRSYTTNTNKGEDMFIDLFQTNDNGIILLLKPPSKRFTSLEVFLFLVSLQSQQHLRLLQQEVYDVCSQMKTKMQELDQKLAKLK